MNNAIQIEGLNARYSKRGILQDLNLSVPAGSVTALLGSNGAGKSTLLRVLTAELKAKSGKALVLGLDPWRRMKEVRRMTGYVPERTDLPAWMRIEDHLRFLRPFYPSWDEAEAARLLDLFELDPRCKYAELSKGQRMLENLCCALAYRPRLLLLDEPFSGLDVVARRRVFEGVLDHLREDGRSALIVSHSIVDVERCADRIALLHDGGILFEGELDEIQRRAARVRVRLSADALDWTPPGKPICEGGGDERSLFYLDFNESLRAELEQDPAALEVELLPRDLEDVLVAVSTRKAVA